MKEYEIFAKKHNLIENPREKYNKFWLNYCDFLNIDTSKYITKEKLKRLCKTHKIKDKIDYYNRLYQGNEDKVPEDACEYYKVKNFYYFLEKNEELFL
jgi:hypothetical protein